MNNSVAIVQQLADFACGVSLKTIPNKVVGEAKRCIVDTVGVITAGQVATITKSIRHHAIETYGKGEATILGSSHKLHPMGAALVNGTSGHANDFDDTSYTGIMHGSVVVLPAAIAMAEHQGVNGEKLIEAFIAGVEVEYAIAELCTHHLYFKGWWTSGVYGTIGSATACAIILGLDNAGVANAISMATCLTTGMKVAFGTDAKPLGIGMAASRGIECALLSASGLTGPMSAFEDDRGFLKLFNDNKHLSCVDLKLSAKWRLTDPGILFKSYPVCSAAQAGIELTSMLIKQHNLTCDDIKSVTCEVPPLVSLSLVYNHPISVREAQFSMPFAIGCILAFGDISLNHLNFETLSNQQLSTSMAKVEMHLSEELASDPSTLERCPEGAYVTLNLTNKRQIRDFLPRPKGMPGNEVSNEFLEDKFCNCFRYGGISEKRARRVAKRLWNLETISNLSSLLS